MKSGAVRGGTKFSNQNPKVENFNASCAGICKAVMLIFCLFVGNWEVHRKEKSAAYQIIQ